MIAWICKKIYEALDNRKGFDLRRSTTLWKVLACGFLFVAADEMFRIHEALDHQLHYLVGAEETRLSDRIDDLILFLYGVGGLGVLYYFREELMKYRIALPFLVAAFAVFFFMVCLDALTNGKDLFNYFFPDLANGQMIFQIICAFEEYLKLAGESIFLGGFYAIYTEVRSNEVAPVMMNTVKAST